MGQRRVLYIPALVVPPVVGILIDHSIVINETSNQITEKTFIVNGPASGTVTMTCTAISGSHFPGDQYLYVSTVGLYMTVGSTFTIPLDATGACSYQTILMAGLRPPIGGILGTLQITAVSSGIIGPFFTKNYSHSN